MSKIKELHFRNAFLENRNVTKDDVLKFLRYINNVGDEGTQFDAKDIGKILGDDLEIAFDKIRTEMGKHFSAMANMAGGLIAVGIRETKGQIPKFTLNPYDVSKFDLQYIQRAIVTSVEPKIEFSVEVVEMENVGGYSKGILLIFIEQSLHPPHQVVCNKTYYFRHGDSSEPATHSLIQAMFRSRRNPELSVDVIKVANPGFLRVLIKNKGNAPAYHTHIVINIFPRLMRGSEYLITDKMIEETTDGIWNIKSNYGSAKQNNMKFRFRASPGEIILPEVNEILFDFPFASYNNAKLTADIFCDGHSTHQEFDLS